MINKAQFQEDGDKMRKEKAEKVVLETLKKMLDENVKFFSTHYIRNRATEIVKHSIELMSFDDKKVQKAREAFLNTLLADVEVANWSKEIVLLEKRRDDASEEDSAKIDQMIERLKSLEEGVAKNKTAERDLKCEPIAQHIAASILKNDMYPPEFVKAAIQLDNELLVSMNAFKFIEAIFERLYTTVDEHYVRANEKLWGCPREDITMQKLDDNLKL